MAKLFQGPLELKLGVAVGGDNEKACLPNLQNYMYIHLTISRQT